MLSIRYRLPLLICGLVLGVIILYGGAAYREARRAALAASHHRLTDVTGRLSALLATAMQRSHNTGRQLSAHAGINAYLRDPTPENQAAVLAMLALLAPFVLPRDRPQPLAFAV